MMKDACRCLLSKYLKDDFKKIVFLFLGEKVQKTKTSFKNPSFSVIKNPSNMKIISCTLLKSGS